MRDTIGRAGRVFAFKLLTGGRKLRQVSLTVGRAGRLFAIESGAKFVGRELHGLRRSRVAVAFRRGPVRLGEEPLEFGLVACSEALVRGLGLLVTGREFGEFGSGPFQFRSGGLILALESGAFGLPGRSAGVEPGQGLDEVAAGVLRVGPIGLGAGDPGTPARFPVGFGRPAFALPGRPRRFRLGPESRRLGRALALRRLDPVAKPCGLGLHLGFQVTDLVPEPGDEVVMIQTRPVALAPERIKLATKPVRLPGLLLDGLRDRELAVDS